MGLRVLELCSGIGGLGLGVGRAISGTRVVGHVERDAFAASVLLARMADAALDQAPIWCGDLAEFPAELFAGVEIVTAGFPCQPVSVAGSQRGTADPRWLWSAVHRTLRIVRPRFVVLENVPGLVSSHAAFEEVLGSLAELGFDARWGCLRASDVGATHRRNRWFCVAYADQPGLEGRRKPQRERIDERPVGPDCAEMADTGREHLRVEPRRIEWTSRPGEVESARVGGEMADANDVDRRSGGTAWPPGPEDTEGWKRWLTAGGPAPAVDGALNPEFVEALMGYPVGWTHVEGASRADRLRCLGNAVVPQQAAAAVAALLRRP